MTSETNIKQHHSSSTYTALPNSNIAFWDHMNLPSVQTIDLSSKVKGKNTIPNTYLNPSNLDIALWLIQKQHLKKECYLWILPTDQSALDMSTILQSLCTDQEKETIRFFPNINSKDDYFSFSKSFLETNDKNANLKLYKNAFFYSLLLNPTYHQKPSITVVSLKTYVQLYCAHPKASYILKTHTNYDFFSIIRRLVQMGYEKIENIENYGDFSIKGDTIEIYSIAYEYPFRLHFFDNSIESIDLFYLTSHKTVHNVQNIVIYAHTWDNISYVTWKSFYDYIQPDHVLLYDHIIHDLKYLGDHLNDDEPIKKTSHFITEAQLQKEWNQAYLFLNHHDNAKSFAELRIGNPIKNFIKLTEDHLNKDKKIVLAAQSSASLDRILLQFQDQHIHKPSFMFHLQDFVTHPHVGIMVMNLSHGYISHGFQNHSLWIITESDLYGKQHMLTKRVKRFREYLDLSLLQTDDIVVHIDYGIGCFKGLQWLNIDTVEQELFVIEFAKGDKVYIPVLNSDKLHRFGSSDPTINLDSLRHNTWIKRYTNATHKMTLMAKDLIEVAAKRKLIHTTPIELHKQQYDLFVQEFPYTLTEGQYQAEQAVLKDLSQPHPMDRLVCGDAGYGKTEIALRASAIVALAGFQVLMVVPTTLLAWQHYELFKKRFALFPHCKVELYIGRMSHTQKMRVKENLLNGGTSIVIGTLGLFLNIGLKKPGLLIIDEEQNFGVAKKEKLKSLYPSLHTLFVSATPIPRTLQLAISGIKDLSLITSAPKNRRNVESSIIKLSYPILLKALEHEIRGGGQVFCVSPRIEWLDRIYQHLLQMDKNISMFTVHGKMRSDLLESRIQQFIEGKVQVLLSTNIIESGLDIPNANTIFVFYAEYFGMAQLYQLRGRVGRSDKQGYCYFITSDHITESAKKRLQILQNLEFSGNSFSLSSEDLDLRGMGNMVGKEQSGAISGLGVELYQSMLTESIENLKQSPENIVHFIPSVEVKVNAYIPDTYIDNSINRTQIYRHLAKISSIEQLEDFALSMEEKYGQIPDSVMLLFKLIEIKDICKRTFVSSIEGGHKSIRIGFYNNTFPNPTGLLGYIKLHSNISIHQGQKLLLKNNEIGKDHSLQLLKNIISLLQDLQSLLK